MRYVCGVTLVVSYAIDIGIFSCSKHTVRSDPKKETSVTKSSSEELRIVTEALSVVLR